MHERAVLRHLRDAGGLRHLEAYVDEAGDLHVDGYDLGPGTSVVSPDGEYEWFQRIAAADLPRLGALLGVRPGEGILEVLARDWTGERSGEFERLLRESAIHVELRIW